jgi:hypothetical protein
MSATIEMPQQYLQVVDGANMGTDAELDSLRAEHARLLAQVEAMGLPVAPIAKPVQGLGRAPAEPEPQAGECEDCAILRHKLRMQVEDTQVQLRALRAEVGRETKKRVAQHRKFLALSARQITYRQQIALLHRALGRKQQDVMKGSRLRAVPKVKVETA